jgi:hypothetical protein
MYIKVLGENEKEKVVNVPIDSYSKFYADGNIVKFVTGSELVEDENGFAVEDEDGNYVYEETFDGLRFKDEQEAIDAMNRIFERLGFKRPMSNVLDLTVSAMELVEKEPEMDDNEPQDEDMEDLQE